MLGFYSIKRKNERKKKHIKLDDWIAIRNRRLRGVNMAVVAPAHHNRQQNNMHNITENASVKISVDFNIIICYSTE